MESNFAKIQSQKNDVRASISVLKSKLSESEKHEMADKIFAKVETLSAFQNAETILFYWSTKDELPTQQFVQKWSFYKKILLPIVDGNLLIIKEFTGVEGLQKGNLGIWEPAASGTFVGSIDLILVPGVAFDIHKNRLGRGKGFYDRFFKSVDVEKWGVGFDFQLVDSIPTDENDVQLDKIITASRVIE